MERDTPAAPAVLCVVAIRRFGTLARDGRARLELTDAGTASTPCSCAGLASLLRAGHLGLRVGAKVLVQGAELRGSLRACPAPLKKRKDLHLALHFNGVRPARWDARLGVREKRVAVPLRTLRPDGGACASAVVYVERVYPCAFGSRLTRRATNGRTAGTRRGAREGSMGTGAGRGGGTNPRGGNGRGDEREARVGAAGAPGSRAKGDREMETGDRAGRLGGARSRRFFARVSSSATCDARAAAASPAFSSRRARGPSYRVPPARRCSPPTTSPTS